ncbi:polysaccharide pyruvyl transferase family protein [uncultured Croceitalea sp.]|uniref:polysaccharide pyruvyl transferase family protein n=1 Tax=uncultured Croceitalea sp. TaxID=1798908 RepID=UPI0033063417
MSDNRYSLYGYFGFQNIGDDIMLLNALNYFDEFRKDSKFYVFVNEDYYSTNSDYTNYSNIQVSYIKLSPFINRIAVYYYASLVKEAFWIGGTCLYETSSSGLTGVQWLMRLIKKYNGLSKDFSFCNIGIGEFTSEKGKILYKDIVFYSKYISCRDQLSFSKVKEHFKEDVSKFIKGGDLASLIDYRREGTPRDYTLVFCGHYQYHSDTKVIAFYSEMLNELGKLGFDILFVPMHQGVDNDNIFHYKIAENLKCKYDVISYTPREIFAWLEKGKFIISMRLHGVFLSDIIGVPNIGIAYHEKVSTYVNNTEVLTSIRNKQLGETITKEEILWVIEKYIKPENFLAKEKIEAINGMPIFEH